MIPSPSRKCGVVRDPAGTAFIAVRPCAATDFADVFERVGEALQRGKCGLHSSVLVHNTVGIIGLTAPAVRAVTESTGVCS